MKILAFTDVHGNKKIIKEIIEKAKKADILICCGDMTNYGNELENILKRFKDLKKNMVLIPGNHEDYEDIKLLCNKYDFLINVHLRMFKYGDFLFFGYGTGGFNYVDIELEEKMKKIKFDKKDKIIFITHGPPYGTKLDKLDGLGYRGSRTLRKFIERFKPKLYLCGHLHENFGKQEKIGETLIINPGRTGMIIEI